MSSRPPRSSARPPRSSAPQPGRAAAALPADHERDRVQRAHHHADPALPGRDARGADAALGGARGRAATASNGGRRPTTEGGRRARDLERLHQLRPGHDPGLGGPRAAAQRRQLPHALARQTGQPVKQKRWDPERDVEVGPDDTVKGWEVSKGQLPAGGGRRARALRRPPGEDDPDPAVRRALRGRPGLLRARLLARAPGARRAALRAADAARWSESGRAALGRFVLSTKEHLVLLRPTDGMLDARDPLLPRGRPGARQEARSSSGSRASTCPTRSWRWPSSSWRAWPSRSRPRSTPTRRARALRRVPRGQGRRRRRSPRPRRRREPAPVIDLMAALKASLAAAGGGRADGAEKEKAAKPRRRKAS